MKFAVTFPYGPLGAVTAFGITVVAPEGAVRDTLPLGAVKPEPKAVTAVPTGPDEGFGAPATRYSAAQRANSGFVPGLEAGCSCTSYRTSSAKFLTAASRLVRSRCVPELDTAAVSPPMRPMTQMEMMARETSSSTRVSPASRDRI